MPPQRQGRPLRDRKIARHHGPEPAWIIEARREISVEVLVEMVIGKTGIGTQWANLRLGKLGGAVRMTSLLAHLLEAIDGRRE